MSTRPVGVDTRPDATTFIVASTSKRHWVILVRDDEGRCWPVQPGVMYPTRSAAMQAGLTVVR